MTVRDLNRDQLKELKANHLMDTWVSVSWEELACADEIISDEEIYKEYSIYNFSEDDFSC